MEQLVQEFISHLTLPGQKAGKPFVLGIIGNLGSGKSTVARAIVNLMPGLVYVQGDSARWLLKQHDMSWGENVKRLVEGVAQQLIGQGYAVVTEAFTADRQHRERMAVWAKEVGVPLMFVRVVVDVDTCRQRLKAKYDDHSWPSTFDHFRVSDSTEKMLVNLDERAKVHALLENQHPEGLVRGIDNNGTLADLERQVPAIISAIREKLL